MDRGTLKGAFSGAFGRRLVLCGGRADIRREKGRLLMPRCIVAVDNYDDNDDSEW